MALLLEVALVVLLLGVVAGRWRRLLRWLVCDPREFVALPRRRGVEGVRQVAEALGSWAGDDGSPRGAVARLAAALAASDPQQRAAGCNEALLDLEGFAVSIDGDGALLRLGILGTLFALALAVIGGGELGRVLVDVLGVGGGGLLVLLTARREGSRVEAAFREGVDAWVAQSLQAWGPEASGPAKVDRRRRNV